MTFRPKTEPFHLSLGERGEMLAGGYLVRNGYKILNKNYRCPIGEIDVVAEKNGRILFIEIKTRNSDMFGRPEEAVHEAKQKKLVHLAQWYLKAKGWEDKPAAFEVLGILWKSGCEPEIRLIENAFTA